MGRLFHVAAADGLSRRPLSYSADQGRGIMWVFSPRLHPGLFHLGLLTLLVISAVASGQPPPGDRTTSERLEELEQRNSELEKALRQQQERTRQLEGQVRDQQAGGRSQAGAKGVGPLPDEKWFKEQ